MIIEGTDKNTISLIKKNYSSLEIPDTIHLFLCDSSQNAVVKRISGNNDVCYPDIYFKHNLEYMAISDNELYEKAVNMQHLFGTCNCIFICCDGNISSLKTLFTSLCGIHSGRGLALPDKNTLFTICNDLSLSETMRGSFTQIIRYYAITGNDYMHLLDNLYNEFKLPVAKKEGKRIYEIVRQRILC